MKSYESLNHTKWECKDHVVFIPKFRRQAVYGQLRKHLGEVFHDLAQPRESKIEQGNLVIDHLPRLISLLTDSALAFTDPIRPAFPHTAPPQGKRNHTS
jgi:REP element-mobilizing transposase RayT